MEKYNESPGGREPVYTDATEGTEDTDPVIPADSEDDE